MEKSFLTNLDLENPKRPSQIKMSIFTSNSVGWSEPAKFRLNCTLPADSICIPTVFLFKIDKLFSNLEGMEVAKMKKRKEMSKLIAEKEEEETKKKYANSNATLNDEYEEEEDEEVEEKEKEEDGYIDNFIRPKSYK